MNLTRSNSCRKASRTAGSNGTAMPSGSVVTTVAEVQAQPGRLIDRYGHEHSEAIFRNWTPAAIKAMGIRRVGGEPKGGAE